MSDVPILIVDDNPLNSKLTRLALQDRGFEVRTASSAADALNVLRTYAPHAILMDLQLPDMDGFQLTRILKGDPATSGIVIVALTAYAMKGDERRAYDAGCDGYIAKPIDTRTLASRLMALLPPAKGETG
jgi:CheY-like chemotaxis protein